MMKWIRSPRVWLGIGVSLVCLWLAVREVPLAEFRSALGRANYLWLIPAVFVQLLAVAARAQRWVVLLGRPGIYWTAFWAHSIGFLFTNVFPLRMGEPARVVVLSERTGIPVVQVAATAVMERILDVAFVVVALVVILPFMQVPPLVVQAGITFGILVLAMVIALWLVVRFRGASQRLLDRLLVRLSFLPREAVQARWGELVEGFAPLNNLRSGSAAVLWTVISWIFSISIYMLVMLAFEPEATVLEAVFIVVVLALAITVPSSPGFIGVFQYVGQQALVLPFGGKYDASTALAITLTAHLIYYVITSMLGLLGLWQIGESFAKLGQMVFSRQAKAASSKEE